jgi:hypothetical protein
MGPLGTSANSVLLYLSRVTVRMKNLTKIGRGNRSSWPDPDANSGRRGVKPATNRLNYGAADSLR